MVTPVQTGLEIAQHCVDPAKLRHIFGFSPAHNGALMMALCRHHACETGQTIITDTRTQAPSTIITKAAWMLVQVAATRICPRRKWFLAS